MNRIPSSIFACLLIVFLSGCGTIERPDGALRAIPSNAMSLDHLGTRSSDPDSVMAFSAAMEALLKSERPISVLAMSGGGANGAYGAGILVGWTETGERPQFDVVTGVSTGALAAPFAFLGSSWDKALADAYTNGRSARLVGMDNLAAFFQPSLFSSAPLRRLVEDNVTEEMLAAIAIEHASGRRLLVATTDLDREETVIWDMGAIASEGGDQAHNLFKEILIASASIPGVFPPVLIAAREDGEAVLQMHVDGGVNLPFVAIPEELLLWTQPDLGQGGRIYVIVNGKVARREGLTAGDAPSILSRTYNSTSKASLRQYLMLTQAFADRNGIGLSVTAIPEASAASSLDFNADAMKKIFDLGFARGSSEAGWSH